MPVMDSRVNGHDRARVSPPSYSGTYTGGSSTNGSVVGGINGTINGYSLMVAGQRTGKTSFLRLLLDSSEISQTATKDQLASVAKFVQGSSAHTSHTRSASIDVELDVDGNGLLQPLALTLVDTPSLRFDDDSSERSVTEILRYIESKLAEGIEDVSPILTMVLFFLIHYFQEWKARTGDHHVHLYVFWPGHSPSAFFLELARLIGLC